MEKLNTMRIAYLALEAPREGVASYVHVTEIIAGLKRRDYNVDLFAPGTGWQRRALPLRLLSHVGLQLRLLTKLTSYSCVYVRAHPLAFPAVLIARLFGRKVIHEVNGVWDDVFVAYPALRPIRRLIQFCQRTQFRNASGLIAVTPQLQDWLTRVIAPRTLPVVVVPNGANVDLFNPSAISTVPLPHRFVVFFGGLTLWHGVRTMVEALKSPHWPADVSLVVVGDGQEMPRLREQSASDPRLIVLGRRPYADVAGIVAKSFCGLVPISDPSGRSAASGLAPLKLYETLACGVPAIVTDLPYQSELVRDANCGLVVPVDDGDALAKAVAQLAADPVAANAMGARGRELVMRLHSWGRRAADTAAFIDKVIGNEQRANNADAATVSSFGAEWTTFRQSAEELPPSELAKLFEKYFAIFPWAELPHDAVGADIGCGSGRFATLAAPRVGHLYAVDASADALSTARQNLSAQTNVTLTEASVGALPFAPASLDFAYSLGVLHHVPHTAAAIKAIAVALKPGAPFLVYLYYALDNRPKWYRRLWQATDAVRRLIVRLPETARYGASQAIAALIYWPLARLAGLIENAGGSPSGIPLSFYRDTPFYVMRTDAYDRFCTPLEQRFSRAQIEQMLTEGGFDAVRFSEQEPYWCAVARRSQ